MSRSHLSLPPLLSTPAFPSHRCRLSLTPHRIGRSPKDSHTPSLAIARPFSRDQLTLPSCPVVQPLPAATSPNSKSTKCPAPVARTLPLPCTVALISPHCCPCLGPDLHMSPLSFWPLTGHTVQDCHLCFLSFSSHCTLVFWSFPLALPEPHRHFSRLAARGKGVLSLSIEPWCKSPEWTHDPPREDAHQQ